MTPPLATARAFLVILFLGLFALTARNVTDPDVWWHLKTGELISEHKSVPHADPFSYTRTGQPWVAHEWLTELFLYEMQRTVGFAGLILIFSAILVAAFFLLYLRCGTSIYVAGISTLIGAWATAPLWGVRPQVITLFLTSLWLFILERAEGTPKLLWFTLPLTLLWVNLHAGFALGLTLFFLFLAGTRIERFLHHPAPGPSLSISAGILFFDLLLVPLNPNGLRLYSYPVETLRSTAMQTYIAEWASPNFHRPEYYPFLLILLTTLAMLAWSRIPLRPRDFLLLLISLFAALVSIRMIPLFVLVAVPLIARRLGNWPRSIHLRQSSTRSLCNAAIIAAMAIFAVVRVSQVIQRQSAVEARQFPAAAAAFLQTHPPAGPVFNHYDWGGYLIWKLSPSMPVFIDGRADLYGPDLLQDFADAYQLKARWRQVLQQWRIQTVVVPADSALALGLRAAPGWVIAYRDSQSIVFNALP